MSGLLEKLAVDIGEEFKLQPQGSGIAQAPGYASIGELISSFLPNIYVIASLILFVLLIVGGFAIITSGDNSQKKGQGAKAVTSAVAGYIIIFVSYWIIKLIEFLTGVKIFSPFGGE